MDSMFISVSNILNGTTEVWLYRENAFVLGNRRSNM